MDYFTVVCSITWPLNGREAGGDLVLIQTSLLLFVNYVVLMLTRCIYMTIKRRLYQSKVTSSLAAIRRPVYTVKLSVEITTGNLNMLRPSLKNCINFIISLKCLYYKHTVIISGAVSCTCYKV